MSTDSGMQVVVSGYETLEGPAFDRHGNLFFVDWDAHSIVKVTPDGEASEFYNTGGIPAGLAFHPDGSLWVADEGEDIHGVLRITPDGQARVVADSYNGNPLHGANDLVFDRAGNCYFSDPWGTSAENPVGGFYRILANGRLEQLDSGLAFPNGVALDSTEAYVYLAETYVNRIWRYPIARDGSVGPREEWAETTLPSGPDGMAFAANGDLYVAHFGAGTIDIFHPNGKQTGTIQVPGSKPTNVAFGGPNNSTLYITECTSHTLYRIPLSVAGLPLNDGIAR